MGWLVAIIVLPLLFIVGATVAVLKLTFCSCGWCSLRRGRSVGGDDPIDLATSRYQAKDLIVASGLVSVGISIGRPRFPLGYTVVYLREAAPWGLKRITDNDEFRDRYLARLDAIGIEGFQRCFTEISEAHDARGLCFLCFEPVGVFCHRHLFAGWLERQTGQRVRELVGEISG
jgi:hypothetical protein